MVTAPWVLDRENACGKAMGESEDKLRQSVEFRCAGRIECLLGRRGLSRERASPKRVETLPSTPAQNGAWAGAAHALETKSEGSCFPWIQKRDLRICEVAHVA
jgi:hypothetical protein